MELLEQIATLRVSDWLRRATRGANEPSTETSLLRENSGSLSEQSVYLLTVAHCCQLFAPGRQISEGAGAYLGWRLWFSVLKLVLEAEEG